MQINSYKKRYIFFIGLVILTSIISQIMVQDRLEMQNEDAKLVNIAGRQRMLSQRIAKRVMYSYNLLQDTDSIYQNHMDTLAVQIDRFEKVHFGLINNEISLDLNKPLSQEVRNLLEENTPYLNNILFAGRAIIKDPRLEVFETSIDILEENDQEFLLRMENIVSSLQDEFEVKLAKLKSIELILLAVSIILILLSFRLVIIPLIRALTVKNKSLAVLSEQTNLQNRQLLEFAHITSHNLRAPASNLKSLIKFYQEENDPNEKALLIAHIETVSSHLNNTLEDLMATLKVKEDTKTDLEYVDFDYTIQKIKEILFIQIRESETEIQTDFRHCHGMISNRIYLESIFLNLISNAIKYSSTNRKPIIKIKAKKKAGRIKLSFQDNGLGIDMTKYGEKIFGLNNTFHQHKDAKGVGLYLTKTQIEAMGGEIFVESEVDQGSIFTLSFH